MPHTRTLPTTASPMVLVVLLWGLLWGLGAQQMTPLAPSTPETADRVAGIVAEDVWRPAWSERFPGCVAVALWPQGERPSTVLTRRGDGDLARVRPERAGDALSASWVVGACR